MTSVDNDIPVISTSRIFSMKRWLKRTLIGVFGASIIVGGLSACGHGMHHGGWNASEADSAKMREHMVDRAADKLKLDDAQKQRLTTLAAKLHEERLALVGSTTDPRAEMQALVAGATFDRGHAQAFVDAKTDVLRSKSPEVIAAAADFYDSLRPEQQQQVRDFMSRRGGWGRRS
jgi:periplasmic protein CpxP/Spy